MICNYWLPLNKRNLITTPKTIDDVIRGLEGHFHVLKEMQAAGVTLDAKNYAVLITDDPSVAKKFGFYEKTMFRLRSECPDCHVGVGEFHDLGCDCDQCPDCGLQRMNCGDVPDEERLPFTGCLAGEAEAQELGWYFRWLSGGIQEDCEADDPGAVPNAERVLAQGRWDRDAKRFFVDEEASKHNTCAEVCECGH